MNYRINPLVFIFYNILFPCIAMFIHGRGISIYFYTISSLFLIYMQKYRRLIKVWTISICLYTAYYLLSLSGIEFLQFIALMLMMTVRLMPSYIVASILICDYRTSEIISALQQVHIPKPIIIGITITLRYIPTFHNELHYINESMRLRGIRFSVKQLLKSFAYFVVPQLFRCLILADELTSAGLCKGIDYDQRRTSYYDVRFCWRDTVVSLLIGLGLAWEMLWTRL